jgi:hypothetical protein
MSDKKRCRKCGETCDGLLTQSADETWVCAVCLMGRKRNA